MSDNEALQAHANEKIQRSQQMTDKAQSIWHYESKDEEIGYPNDPVLVEFNDGRYTIIDSEFALLIRPDTNYKRWCRLRELLSLEQSHTSALKRIEELEGQLLGISEQLENMPGNIWHACLEEKEQALAKLKGGCDEN